MVLSPPTRHALLIAATLLVLGCTSEPPCPEFTGSFAEYPVACVLASTDDKLDKANREQVNRLKELIEEISKRTDWNNNQIVGVAQTIQNRVKTEYSEHADYIIVLEEVLENIDFSPGISPDAVVDISSEIIGEHRLE